MSFSSQIESARKLSPIRNSSKGTTALELAREQLMHFSIDANSDMGEAMMSIIESVYQCQMSTDQLWELAQQEVSSIQSDDVIAMFNARKFLSFQFAKLLDNLQQSFRADYQSLNMDTSTLAA